MSKFRLATVAALALVALTLLPGYRGSGRVGDEPPAQGQSR